ncbi:hypothetical protein THIOKS1850011 [Thiocapsa sp. KS1]|nr:hypothetical protein THIOKS1850011 [Thiocapsa sp. KS1]
MVAGGRILVHCHAGRSRWVAVVARELIESRGITRAAALGLVGEKHESYLCVLGRRESDA